MINFFRKKRQNTVLGSNTGKPVFAADRYLKYAIGEILLVVIGILIALQINNWNEHRKTNVLVKLYQKNIIFELEQDLVVLSELDSTYKARKSSIENYIDYYNTENRDSKILKAKSDSTDLHLSRFNSDTYSFQDLITTGNLKLFPAHKKNAILKYKNSLDNYNFLQEKSAEVIINKFEDFEKEVDLIFTNGYANKEHFEVKNWAFDINSHQFRIRNNFIITFFEIFEAQINLLSKMKNYTMELKDILTKE